MKHNSPTLQMRYLSIYIHKSGMSLCSSTATGGVPAAANTMNLQTMDIQALSAMQSQPHVEARPQAAWITHVAPTTSVAQRQFGHPTIISHGFDGRSSLPPKSQAPSSIPESRSVTPWPHAEFTVPASLAELHARRTQFVATALNRGGAGAASSHTGPPDN